MLDHQWSVIIVCPPSQSTDSINTRAAGRLRRFGARFTRQGLARQSLVQIPEQEGLKDLQHAPPAAQIARLDLRGVRPVIDVEVVFREDRSRVDPTCSTGSGFRCESS